MWICGHLAASTEELSLAVKIRLARHGSKGNPYYRIVVADSRSPRDGRNVEEVGRYNPMVDPAVVTFDLEKVEAWIAKGAQPTDTVASLLKHYKDGQPVGKAGEEKKLSKKAAAKAAAAAEAAE